MGFERIISVQEGDTDFEGIDMACMWEFNLWEWMRSNSDSKEGQESRSEGSQYSRLELRKEKGLERTSCPKNPEKRPHIRKGVASHG